jgi:uncharacterized membrane protein
MEQTITQGQATTTTDNMPKIIYILYMVGVFVFIPGIVGVIIAYVNKDEAPDWLKSHYRFQIRTFWIGGLFMLIATLFNIFFAWLFLIGTLIAFLIMTLWIVWLLIRCVKGLKFLSKKQAHPDPTSWLF